MKFNTRVTILYKVISLLIAVICFCGCSFQNANDTIDSKTKVKNLVIYYTNNITKDDINALVDAELLSQETIKLDKQGTTYFVYFIESTGYLKKLKDGTEDVEFDRTYENETRTISDLAYNGSPVVVNACDDSFLVYKSYKYDPTNSPTPS